MARTSRHDVPPLWVYKCNARNGPHQSSYGDWRKFFRKPGNGSWGGTWGIKNPASVQILRSRIRPGDWVLSYQTDLRGAIGLCEVIDVREDDNGDTNLYLRPILRFPRPVDILARKRNDRSVAQVRAFRQGQVQTLYETSPEEARTLLAVCGAEIAPGLNPHRRAPRPSRTAVKANPSRRRADPPAKARESERGRTEEASAQEQVFHAMARTGAGFGDPAMNKRVERAALRRVTAKFQGDGYVVRDFSNENRGYDLLCEKTSERLRVEVKGVRADALAFFMTAGEHKFSGNNADFRLAVVRRALRRSAVVEIFDREQFRTQFSAEPVVFRCEAKRP